MRLDGWECNLSYGGVQGRTQARLPTMQPCRCPTWHTR